MTGGLRPRFLGDHKFVNEDVQARRADSEVKSGRSQSDCAPSRSHPRNQRDLDSASTVYAYRTHFIKLTTVQHVRIPLSQPWSP